MVDFPRPCPDPITYFKSMPTTGFYDHNYLLGTDSIHADITYACRVTGSAQ